MEYRKVNQGIVQPVKEENTFLCEDGFRRLIELGRPMTKAAKAMGISLSTETVDRLQNYHHRMSKAVWEYTRKTHSWSRTAELAIRAGLDILEDMEDRRVAELIDREEPVPKKVIKQKSKRLSRTIGDLSEGEVKELSEK